MLRPNLAHIVCDPRLGAQAFCVVRHETVWEAGRAQETETSVPAVGNIQPASPRQLSQLPEGDRESGTIVIRTTACVRNTDTIRWQGASWRVTSVLHWNPHGYYEVYAARL